MFELRDGYVLDQVTFVGINSRYVAISHFIIHCHFMESSTGVSGFFF